jgi:hypothetical protein
LGYFPELFRAASERLNIPQALGWLIANQLPDGSWGDPVLIMYHDRILSTLSALVALRTWGAAPAAVVRGERFVRAHVGHLALEARELATIGFELLFPSLMETAEQLGLDLPYNHPHVKSRRRCAQESSRVCPSRSVHRCHQIGNED